MFTVRRDSFGDLWNEMNRVQEDVQRLFGRAGLARPRSGVPVVNLWEDEHAYIAEFDLPGFAIDKFDVQITEGNVLTVSGERQPIELPQAVWHRQERGYGTFGRSLTLPAIVDADRVEARYEHGVLRLTLPKSEAAKPRKITVRTE